MCLCACVCVCAHMCVYVFICLCVCKCVCVHVCMHCMYQRLTLVLLPWSFSTLFFKTKSFTILRTHRFTQASQWSPSRHLSVSPPSPSALELQTHAALFGFYNFFMCTRIYNQVLIASEPSHELHPTKSPLIVLACQNLHIHIVSQISTWAFHGDIQTTVVCIQRSDPSHRGNEETSAAQNLYIFSNAIYNTLFLSLKKIAEKQYLEKVPLFTVKCKMYWSVGRPYVTYF